VFTVVESPRPGLATSWLASLQAHTYTLQIFPRQRRDFRPPALAENYIMVSAGSGIGPFYGFLRHQQEERKVYRGPLGEAWLFFGCRSRQLDFLYEKELQQLSEYGVLSRLTVCFSRDKANSLANEITAKGDVKDNGSGDVAVEQANVSKNGKYVQDGMMDDGEELANWILDKGAKFYVCGDATNMGRAVQAALVQLLAKHAGSRLGSETAADYVTRMMTEKRYLQDVWI
jgi:sulfite reductase alpha subunit-like flavoprotein